MHQLPRLNAKDNYETQIHVEFRYETWNVAMNAVLTLGINTIGFRVMEEPLASVNCRICNCNRVSARMNHWLAATLGRDWHVLSHEIFRRDPKQIGWFRMTPEWPADFCVLYRPKDDVARAELARWLCKYCGGR